MGIFDKLFGKKKKEEKVQPRKIREFVLRAVKGSSNCKIKISKFSDLYYALADGLVKKGITNSLLDSKIVGICPECYFMYTPEWLSWVATLRESGLVSKSIGMSSASIRFLKGKCRNSYCNCEEILILWGPHAFSPFDICKEALEDKLAEVRKVVAKSLGEIPPESSGYLDKSFVRAAVPALTKMLKDENNDVREAAKEAINKIKLRSK